MANFPKLLIVGGVVLSLALFTILFLPVSLPGQDETPGNGTSSGGSQSGNAFTPNIPAYDDQTPAQQSPKPTPQADLFADLRKLGESFSTSFFATSSLPAGILELPSVSDGELRIDVTGVGTTGEYLEYFTLHVKEIAFSYKKFNPVLKDEDGVFLLPQELIDKGLAENNFAGVVPSLAVAKEFLTAKIGYLKSIGVHGEAAGFNKRMIAFDRLTIALIDAAIRFKDTKTGETELKKFLENYRITVTYYHSELARELQLAASETKPGSFFSRLALRFVPQVLAAHNPTHSALPMGGQIPKTGSPITPCECDPTGFKVTVSNRIVFKGKETIIDPKFTGIFYFTTALMHSPNIFGEKTVREGHYVLGMYRLLNPSLACNPQEEEVCEDIQGTSTQNCRIEMVCRGEVPKVITIAGTAKAQ